MYRRCVVGRPRVEAFRSRLSERLAQDFVDFCFPELLNVLDKVSGNLDVLAEKSLTDLLAHGLLPSTASQLVTGFLGMLPSPPRPPHHEIWKRYQSTSKKHANALQIARVHLQSCFNTKLTSPPACDI